MSDLCSNTALLNEFEHQQFLAERELTQALDDQERAGIDPVASHVADLLGYFEFYGHVAEALVDNALIDSLLVVLMCGDPADGAKAARSIVSRMAELHAQQATDEAGGLYVPEYEPRDADASVAMAELNQYLRGLGR